MTRLIAFLSTGIAIVAFSDWEPLDILGLAFIGLVLISFVWSRRSLASLSTARRLSRDHAQVGETIEDTILVRNAARLPRLWLEFRDLSSLPLHQAGRVLHLKARSGEQWSVETICAKRGRYHVGPTMLRAGDPFGLFPRQRLDAQTIDVTIYPPEFEITGFVTTPGLLSGAAISSQRSPFVTPSVSMVRDYVVGDAFNRISWSSSARLGKLMIKEFDADPTADTWIVVDLDRQFRAEARRRPNDQTDARFDPHSWLTSTDDYAAAAACSIAKHVVAGGRAVGMIATGARREVIHAERSTRVRQRILESLAVAQADGQIPLAEVLIAEWRRFSRHSSVVLITSASEDSWVDAAAELTARRVFVVVVAIDGGSFDLDARMPSPPMELLALRAIPTYLLRYGQHLPAGLSNRVI